MELSEIQRLPIDAKREWLLSVDGLTQLRIWHSQSISLSQIARLLQVDYKTLYRWRRYYPEITEILGKPKPKSELEFKQLKPDLSRPPTYRIIAGLDQYYRGVVLCEYATVKELWNSNFVENYFASFGRSANDYLEDYLEEIARGGLFRFSNTYCATFCNFNKKGIVKPLV